MEIGIIWFENEIKTGGHRFRFEQKTHRKYTQHVLIKYALSRIVYDSRAKVQKRFLGSSYDLDPNKFDRVELHVLVRFFIISIYLKSKRKNDSSPLFRDKNRSRWTGMRPV